MTDQNGEGDVDREYCRRVTLAYLTHINHHQEEPWN